ncbi:ovoinhibitor-like [Homarus americanus]|uniref:Serine protease inhibitor dipetalogastin-like 4 n=1 Tax=Homarus americanus TaxID=6706 RepID=A0A8J5JPC0_HOMAM|nr:ovoinhibitor-like [Homarus americanus]KAG7159806.1 Serine protease inhibitor dipetalogastin-like 4 [Homarus americanus]
MNRFLLLSSIPPTGVALLQVTHGKMRALNPIISTLLLVLLMTTPAYLAKKVKQGCAVGRKIHPPGKVVLKDRAHCLALKCYKRGKEFIVKPTLLKNCECASLCSDGRCTPAEPVVPVERVVPCPKCDTAEDFVCGTNDITYTNPCILTASTPPCGPDKASLQYYGACGECPRGCPKVIEPVCGSNGVTYNNTCLLNAATACLNSSITLLSEGICGGERETDCRACPKIARPVCGTDDKTYPNLCMLENVSLCTSVNVYLAHLGFCDNNKIKAQRACLFNGDKYAVGDVIADLPRHCATLTCGVNAKGRPKLTVKSKDQDASV